MTSIQFYQSTLLTRNDLLAHRGKAILLHFAPGSSYRTRLTTVNGDR